MIIKLHTSTCIYIKNGFLEDRRFASLQKQEKTFYLLEDQNSERISLYRVHTYNPLRQLSFVGII